MKFYTSVVLLGNEYLRFKKSKYYRKKSNINFIIPDSSLLSYTTMPKKGYESKTYSSGNIKNINIDFVNHTYLTLSSIRLMEINLNYVIGFDGYEKSNMFTNTITRINETLFKWCKDNSIVLKSLTKTSYSNLIKDSIYFYDK